MKAFSLFCFPLLLFWCCSFSSSAQIQINQISLETGNAITALPFTGALQLFYANYHPFTTIEARILWQAKGKHAWEQSVSLGYLYHRFVQHSIPLFTEAIYRHNLGEKFRIRVHLGGGYLHSIPASDRFELKSNGNYEQIKSLGRAQGGFKLSFSGAYLLQNDIALTLKYGVMGQMPFVKSYVPLLPFNFIQLGLTKNISQ